MARSPIGGRCEGRSPSVQVKPHLHRYFCDADANPFLRIRGSVDRNAIAMRWFIDIKAIAANQHFKQTGFDLFWAGIIVGSKVLIPSS